MKLNLLLSLSDLEDQQPVQRVKTPKPYQKEESRDSKRSKTRNKDFSNQRALKRSYE